jgi:hypothetical protein
MVDTATLDKLTDLKANLLAQRAEWPRPGLLVCSRRNWQERVKVCRRKTRFDNRLDAEHRIAKLRSQVRIGRRPLRVKAPGEQPGAPIRVYACLVCHGFHLTGQL